MNSELPGLKAHIKLPAKYLKTEARSLISRLTGTKVSAEYFDFLLTQYARQKGFSSVKLKGLLKSPEISCEAFKTLIELEKEIHPFKGGILPEVTEQDLEFSEAEPTKFWKAKARFVVRVFRPKAQAYREKWLGSSKPLESLKQAENWIKKEHAKEVENFFQRVELAVPSNFFSKQANFEVWQSSSFGKALSHQVLRKDSKVMKVQSEVLHYPDSNGWEKAIPISYSDGALLQLRSLAREMAKESNWGKEAHWVAFILTEMIHFSFLQGLTKVTKSSVSGVTAKIVIEADPWVNPDELVAFYKQLRERLEKKAQESLGLAAYQTKRPTAKVLSLLYFVEEKEKMSWEEKYNNWNTTFPNWSYKSLNSFKTSYLKVKKALGKNFFRRGNLNADI